MESAVRVLLVGAQGRLGQAISRVAQLDKAVVIVARCGRGDSIDEFIGQSDAVLDVSSASATDEICRVCVAHRKALVIGTTGQSPEQIRIIETAAKTIPIVLAPNFSVGVNVLFWLARKAAGLLGGNFDVEIIEAHHQSKKDAPSGTAKRLAQVLHDVRPGEIATHSMRAGDIVGDHTVMFAGSGERLELTHRASSRDTFAVGALRAAHWIVHQQPRLYEMEHVLGLDRTR